MGRTLNQVSTKTIFLLKLTAFKHEFVLPEQAKTIEKDWHDSCPLAKFNKCIM